MKIVGIDYGDRYVGFASCDPGLLVAVPMGAEKVKEYSEKMKALEVQRDELQSLEVKYAEVKTWLDVFIDQTMQPDRMTTVDGTTMKMLVEKIIARDTGIEVVFKCGVSIEKEFVR